MTGEDPGRPRVEAAAAVGWQLGYAYGIEAGYRAGIAAADQAWRELSEARLHVVEPQQVIFIEGERLMRPTWRERRAEREATLRDGHAAGLHRGRTPYECPLCPVKVPPLQHKGHYGADERPMHYCTNDDRTACGKFAGMVYQYSATWENVTCAECRGPVGGGDGDAPTKAEREAWLAGRGPITGDEVLKFAPGACGVCGASWGTVHQHG